MVVSRTARGTCFRLDRGRPLKVPPVPVDPDRVTRLEVILTGSPRTGTSFLASLVHDMTGLPMGERLKPADERNVHGYFELLPLMRLEDELLGLLGGDFANPPAVPERWPDALAEPRRRMQAIVDEHGARLYKGNRAMILADLYDELFPDARWIRIDRDVEATHRSRWGAPLSIDAWREISEARTRAWRRTRPSRRAYEVRYEDFELAPERAVEDLAAFLELEWTPDDTRAALARWKPRRVAG